MSEARFDLIDFNWVASGRRQSPSKRDLRLADQNLALWHGSGSTHARPAEMAEFIRQKLHIAKLERDIKKYKTETGQIAADMLSKLISLTAGLFGDEVKICESFDPEFPDDKFVLFTVEAKMEPAQIVEAEQDWIRGVSVIAPNWNSMRLLIFPAP